ncbi:glycosyltransferase [Brucella tritici]|uniref:glycosyltransferase n=1 Tax=Brucella tritici TaxID=94626 RepID=UPI00158FA551|nr:glycosyltransferase [Brucella tritici]
MKHYVRHGAKEGRNPTPSFSTTGYIAANPDVASAKVNPLFHYAKFGRTEGRPLISKDAPIGTASASRPTKKTTLTDTVTDTDYINSLIRYYSLHKYSIDACKVSIIIPTHNRENTICAAIDSALAQSHSNHEIIVCDDGSTDNTMSIISRRYANIPSIKILALPKTHVSQTRNAGLDIATGEYIAFLDSDNIWFHDYLRFMLCVCMSEKTDIAYAGLVAVDSSDRPVFYRGQEFDRDNCRKSNFVDLNVYFYKKTPTTDIRFDTSLKRTVDWDFILQQTVDQKVVYAPFIGCRYTHDMGDDTRISVSQPNIYRAIVKARHSEPIPIADADLHQAIKLKIALKIPAPRAKAAEWGDYHFAASLSKSLGELGHATRIDFLEDWPSRRHEQSDDVVIVLRGLSRYTPSPAAINIMWNISHPDQVDYSEYDEYNIVYSASESYTSLLKNLTNTRVKTLYQATDTARFNPERYSAHMEHDLLFVGNSRKIYRDIVKWAVDAGHTPTVYGTLWENYIPKHMIQGKNISNDRLGKYYASAHIVLNDHWESMREYGLLSNRLFDCVACNTTVISDAVTSLSSIFDGAVVQVSSQAELEEAIEVPKKNQNDITEKVGAFIRQHHNFDVRAKTIVRDVLEYVGVDCPEVKLASPFIAKSTPVNVSAVSTWTGRHYQSSLYLRLLSPLTAEVNNNGFDVTCYPCSESEKIKDCDVAVIQRTSLHTTDEAERVIEIAQKRKIKLITDVDDGFIHISQSHPEYETYRQRNDALNLLISHADDNWYSTKHLLEQYRKFNRNPAVVPNCLDPRIWRNYRHQHRAFGTDKLHMVYMGTATHDDDFYMILEEMDRLNELAPDSFDLTIIGAVRNTPERDWLKKLSPPAGSTMYPRFARWLMRNNNFDVGLCPLVSNNFNDCKSDLKILDYSALGIVSVVSDCVSYTDTARDNKCAFVVDGTTTWTDTLRTIQEDNSAALAVLDTAKDYLRSQRHVSVAANIMRKRIEEIL